MTTRSTLCILKCCEELSIGGGIKEGMLLGFGVKEAAHGIEFSEIESENLAVDAPWGWGWNL